MHDYSGGAKSLRVLGVLNGQEVTLITLSLDFRSIDWDSERNYDI
jgi:hypothetical protein